MLLKLQSLFRLLRSLPHIRFALMLGGGSVATILVGWILYLIGKGDWPSTEAVAIARILALQWLGLGGLLIIAVVMIALAFGQLDRAKVGVGQVSVDFDFDKPEGASA